MAEDNKRGTDRSQIRVIVLTAAVTLAVAGGGAYLLGYLGPPQTGEQTQRVLAPASSQPGPPAEHPSKEKKILYWRAPMNPAYISDKPGKSPMGMDLVPVYEGEEEQGPTGMVRIDPVVVQEIGVTTTVGRLRETAKGGKPHGQCPGLR